MLIAILSSMIYAVPISIICAVHLFPLFCPDDPAVAPWIVAFFFLTLCAVFRHGSLKIRLIIAAAVIALSTGVFLAVDREERTEFFSERMWIGLLFLVSLTAYAAGELLSSFRVLRIITTVLAFAAGTYMLIRSIDPGAPTCTMLLITVLVTVIREVQQFWKKEGDTDGRRHVVSILPFIILIALFVVSGPTREEPYDWPIAHRLWQLAKDTATKIGQYFSSEDDLARRIGFSFENPTLAAKLSGNADSESLFTVSFTRKETPAINLGACGYNEFDGKTWSNSVGNDIIGRRQPFDYIESLGYMNMKGSDTVSDHMHVYNISVTYSNLNTKYTILPTKYLDSLTKGALFDTVPECGDTVFEDGQRGIGTYYGFGACVLNKNHTKFIELMADTGKPLPEDVWVHSVDEICLLNKPEFPYEDYLSYIESIRRNYYCEVNVSPELRTKLDTLYDGCESDYEKMIRLEAVLSRLKYSTSPGIIPEEVDSPEAFLDWFMLKNPRGYCNYFATVMVLLARAEGLPARYVEGFHVPPSSNGGTEVSNLNAHSWVEIYFEGFGFVSFDPTPGISHESVWQTTSERLEYLSSLSKGTLEAFTTGWESDEDPALLPVEEEPTGPSLALILIPTLMCALLFPAVIILYKIIIRHRFNKLSVDEKAVSLCHSNMRLLRFLGAKPAHGETLHEFAGREKEDIPAGLVDFISLYEVISYSDKTVGNDMLSALVRSNRDLSSYASGKRRIAYFFYSLFTG